jgi:sec-independent protein translocase protein TatB
MMPGLGFTETILLVIVAIVVIGPKDLPLMMRKFGRFTGRMRALAFEFRQGFDELGRQAELDELRREVADLKQKSGLSDLERDMVNDAAGVQEDVSRAMAPEAAPTPAIASPAPATIGPMAAAAAAALAVPPADDPGSAPDGPVEAQLDELDASGEGNRIGAPQPDVLVR